MPNYFFTNSNGTKQGPVNGQQLKALAAQGLITPETIVETEQGKSAPAGKVNGLIFGLIFTVATPPPHLAGMNLSTATTSSPFTQTPPTHPLKHDIMSIVEGLPSEFFCTNCGKPVSEQTTACLSCGAAPIGHRKYCRYCGIGLNPEQVICVKCGVELDRTGVSIASINPFAQAVQTGYSTAQTTGVSLDVKQRKGRIHFWTVLCIATYLLCTLTVILSGALMCAIPEIEKEVRKNSQVQLPGFGGGYRPSIPTASDKEIKETVQRRIGLTVLILFALTGVPYLCCYYYYLLRLWEEIPGKFACTIPGNAAGFALIPIFHLFWLFTAFSGLYRDMNKTTEFYGRGSRFGYWINSICVVWVLLFVSGMVLGAITAEQPVTNGGLTIFFAILGAILTVPVYWKIRNDVHIFIDIKSSVGR